MSSLILRGFMLGFAIAASPGPIFFTSAGDQADVLAVKRVLLIGWSTSFGGKPSEVEADIPLRAHA